MNPQVLPAHPLYWVTREPRDVLQAEVTEGKSVRMLEWSAQGGDSGRSRRNADTVYYSAPQCPPDSLTWRLHCRAPPQDSGASRLGWGLTGGGRRGALWLPRLQSANPQAGARMPLPHAPGASARAHGSLYTVLASFPFTGSTFQM